MNIIEEVKRHTTYHEVLLKILKGEFIENAESKSSQEYLELIRKQYDELLNLFINRVEGIIPKDMSSDKDLFKTLIPKEDLLILFYNVNNKSKSILTKFGLDPGFNISIAKFHDVLLELIKEFSELEKRRLEFIRWCCFLTSLHFESEIDKHFSTHGDQESYYKRMCDSDYIKYAIQDYEKERDRRPQPSGKTMEKHIEKCRDRICFDPKMSLEEHIIFFKSALRKNNKGDIRFTEYRKPLIFIIKSIQFKSPKREFFRTIYKLIPYLCPTVSFYKTENELRKGGGYKNLDEYRSRMAKSYFGF